MMSGFEVELKETVNPALAYVYDYSAETTCTPAGCLGILTRVSQQVQDRTPIDI